MLCMRRYWLLMLLLLSCMSVDAQNYLPLDIFSGQYQYVCSYDRNGNSLGKVTGPSDQAFITVMANNSAGRPRGSITFSFTGVNGAASLNYLGNYTNGWYIFTSASEIYNPMTGGFQLLDSGVVTMKIMVYHDFSKLRYTLQGGQWFEYTRIR